MSRSTKGFGPPNHIHALSLLPGCQQRRSAFIKRLFVALIGGTLLFIGLAMVVLPGPAFLVIPAALAFLGVEFMWARRLLGWLRERFKARSSENTPTTEASAKAARPSVTSRFSTTH